MRQSLGLIHMNALKRLAAAFTIVALAYLAGEALASKPEETSVPEKTRESIEELVDSPEVRERIRDAEDRYNHSEIRTHNLEFDVYHGGKDIGFVYFNTGTDTSSLEIYFYEKTLEPKLDWRPWKWKFKEYEEHYLFTQSGNNYSEVSLTDTSKFKVGGRTLLTEAERFLHGEVTDSTRLYFLGESYKILLSDAGFDSLDVRHAWFNKASSIAKVKDIYLVMHRVPLNTNPPDTLDIPVAGYAIIDPSGVLAKLFANKELFFK